MSDCEVCSDALRTIAEIRETMLAQEAALNAAMMSHASIGSALREIAAVLISQAALWGKEGKLGRDDLAQMVAIAVEVERIGLGIEATLAVVDAQKRRPH